MGVIALALVAYGSLPASDPTPPTWVVVSAATAIALGTYVGGWRIIKTMGSRIHKMDSAQGFAAQGAGAAVILASTHGGFPLSTTHTISGAVIGSGAAKRLSAVRWGVAGNIVAAWIVTLPAAAVIGALTYAITRMFGTGAAGPLIVVRGDPDRRGGPVQPPRPAGLGRRGGGGMTFAAIDWDALLTVIWASLLAGIGAPAAYGLAILGSDARDRARAARAAWPGRSSTGRSARSAWPWCSPRSSSAS